MEDEKTENRGGVLELQVLQSLISALFKSDGIDEVLNLFVKENPKPQTLNPNTQTLNPKP